MKTTILKVKTKNNENGATAILKLRSLRKPDRLIHYLVSS